MGLLEDARNIQRKDPAARSVLEVILLYPGFHILVYHRIAHWLYQHKRFFLARWVSQHGRRRTGIEIHPGATTGRSLSEPIMTATFFIKLSSVCGDAPGAAPGMASVFSFILRLLYAICGAFSIEKYKNQPVIPQVGSLC